MSKKLLLVTYPPLNMVAEQLTMPDDVDGRYGDYTGQKIGKFITDRTIKEIHEVYEVIRIAPERIERISSELGRILIIGNTIEGKPASVDIDPFAELNSIGTILIEE